MSAGTGRISGCSWRRSVWHSSRPTRASRSSSCRTPTCWQRSARGCTGACGGARMIPHRRLNNRRSIRHLFELPTNQALWYHKALWYHTEERGARGFPLEDGIPRLRLVGPKQGGGEAREARTKIPTKRGTLVLHGGTEKRTE